MQDRFIPMYGEQGFVATAAHCLAPGTEADELAVRARMTYPMAYDFDRELFRSYRRPGEVFPLNAVVDREGNLVYVGDDIDEAEAAIVAALDE